MKIKVKIKLSDFEYREFVEGLRHAYATIEPISFRDLVVMETLEEFLLTSFKHIWNTDKTHSFTLNAIQAYAIYTLITSANQNFTPFQSGVNFIVASKIQNVYMSNVNKRINNILVE
ncbi:MAG: hypothetical protein LBR17_01240 [Bacteroidales bacterium]|jgi:hypothetical protein|nr:hypothetical protein [Bacteroidales bacterium]